MKALRLSLSIFVLAATASVISAFSSPAHAALKTVPYVDVGRYLGDWYQIAHIPLYFEGGPCACSRQRLAATDKPGVVSVYNSCNDQNPQGKLRSISGFAYNDDPKSNSKFTVDFNLAFKGSYWIIGLDPEYRYAVVSDQNEYSLYILSKTPTLSADLYKEAVATAKKQLDTSKLKMTVQKGCTYPK